MKTMNDAEMPSVEELNEIESDLASEDSELTKEVSEVDYDGVLDSFKMFLHEIGRYKLLSPEEEFKYAKAYKDTGDKSAKEVLINHNLRLVVNIAKRHLGHGVDLPDLVQEGSIGLIRGIDMFDPDMGFKLSTYSTWWIKQAITRYLANNGRTIRLPVHVSEKVNKYMKFVSSYMSEHNNKMPTDEEISRSLDIPIDKIPLYNSYNNDLISLDAKVGNGDDDSESVLGDFIPSHAMNPEDETFKVCLREDIESLLNDLTDREADIIRLRFGFVDDRQRTLEEVGTIYGVTRERIRQIESKALRKLKHPSRIRKLKDYMPDSKAVSMR